MNLNERKRQLGISEHSAKFFRTFSESKVECYLCPRHCKISDQSHGFCGVRFNNSGKLVTLNYGVSVPITQEVIETEAVLHFAPGAPILSLGNVGCMLNCDYCHNWQTSQTKHVRAEDFKTYTPQEIVQTALDKNIKILSWTYNDPVVWHEFVYDTAKLAKENGLLNLYKSAFYIGPEAIDELHEVIDIFSLSLKSMSPEFYLKVAKGRLQPVLDGIKQVYRFGDRHLEISNLVVTELNDNFEDVKRLADWVLTNLDESVPLHLVRFHPDYKYRNVERTSIDFLKKARDLVLSLGIKNCYLGNIFEQGEWLNSRCQSCSSILVERFGMQSRWVNLRNDGTCRTCGTLSPIKVLAGETNQSIAVPVHSSTNYKKTSHFWHDDINSAHIELFPAYPVVT